MAINDSKEDVAPLARRFLWVDTKSGLNRLIIGLIVLCIFLFAMDFVWHRHVKVPGEEFYGFHAIAGFVSFTVIVLGAKTLRLLIRRDESYYGDSSVDGEASYPEAGTAREVYANWSPDSVADLKAQMLGRAAIVETRHDEYKNAGAADVDASLQMRKVDARQGSVNNSVSGDS